MICWQWNIWDQEHPSLLTHCSWDPAKASRHVDPHHHTLCPSQWISLLSNLEKTPVSGDVCSKFRGKDDYNKFSERVTTHCRWFWPLHLCLSTAHFSDCASILKAVVSKVNQEPLPLLVWGGKGHLHAAQRKETNGLPNSGEQIVGCCADHKKSWLLGDLSVKCSRTVHKGCSSAIFFCQLFWLRTNEGFSKICEGKLKNCWII